MAQHNDLGWRGEQIAKAYLENKGYEIIDENWVYERAEIDLIAYFNSTMIFAEVKTRSSTGFGLPEEFVDAGKQQRMSDAADAYIEIMNHEGEARFDIIAVLFKNHNNYTIKHIEDAFWPNL